jgi:hypothetical protein
VSSALTPATTPARKNFSSDNYAGVHPAVLEAVGEANRGHVTAYGEDPWTALATARLSEAFGAAGVFSGTAANVLGISLTTVPFVRKQQMQLASKMRYLAAQFNALLDDDLWLRNARHANAMARRLSMSSGGWRPSTRPRTTSTPSCQRSGHWQVPRPADPQATGAAGDGALFHVNPKGAGPALALAASGGAGASPAGRHGLDDPVQVLERRELDHDLSPALA